MLERTMPIDTEGRIDRLLQRLHSRGLATDTTTLYSEGIKTKLRQAKFSLETLRQIVPQEVQVQDTTAGLTSQGLLNASELVGFYCDSFWDSLRSALDILGQLVNELRSIGISERKVDIKKVASKVKLTAPASSLDKALDELLNSSAFIQLEDYRHCSMHRRPPFIETRTLTVSVSGTAGYSYSTSSQQITIVKRYLCTNPWDLTPRIYADQRPVVAFNEKLLRRIRGKIDTIVAHLP
jgi:hypothetical protein